MNGAILNSEKKHRGHKYAILLSMIELTSE